MVDYQKKASIIGISPDKIISDIISEYKQKGAEINTLDGVRIDSKEWWVHIRKSNTEPIIRVIGEAQLELEAERIVQEFISKIK